MKKITFIDTEVAVEDKKAYDYGAINEIYEKIHTGKASKFNEFISDSEYLCGHNIVNHDSQYIEVSSSVQLIDTLYLSPLMFPNKPYHKLLKDDKLQSDELNNPLNDAEKAMNLFYDEVNAFRELDDKLKLIYYLLLKDSRYFSGFFSYVDYSENDDIETSILSYFADKLCVNAPLCRYIKESPIELAYCLALISATEQYSLIPRWVIMNYPKVDRIIKELRSTSCGCCDYCK